MHAQVHARISTSSRIGVSIIKSDSPRVSMLVRIRRHILRRIGKIHSTHKCISMKEV